MIKTSKIRRRTVPVRPSRIRRDPIAVPVEKKVNPYPTEREIWMAVPMTILAFLSITALTVGISDVTSH